VLQSAAAVVEVRLDIFLYILVDFFVVEDFKKLKKERKNKRKIVKSNHKRKIFGIDGMK